MDDYLFFRYWKFRSDNQLRAQKYSVTIVLTMALLLYFLAMVYTEPTLKPLEFYQEELVLPFRKITVQNGYKTQGWERSLNLISLILKIKDGCSMTYK